MSTYAQPYLSYFGLTSPPFGLSPDPDLFFGGAHRESALRQLVHFAHMGEGIAVVSGEVGSGKTMLLTMMLCYLRKEKVSDPIPKNGHNTIIPLLINNLMGSRGELMVAVARQLGVAPEHQGVSSLAILQQAIEADIIQRFAKGCRLLMIVDEAHSFPDEALEWLRMLSNLETAQGKMMQIVLFAQPELLPRLGMSALRALADRVTMSMVLSGLNATETAHYVDHRLRLSGYRGSQLFGKSAIQILAKSTGGLSRKIHLLADKALLAAYTDDSKEVLPCHLHQALAEQFSPSVKNRYWLYSAAGSWINAQGLGLILNKVVLAWGVLSVSAVGAIWLTVGKMPLFTVVENERSQSNISAPAITRPLHPDIVFNGVNNPAVRAYLSESERTLTQLLPTDWMIRLTAINIHHEGAEVILDNLKKLPTTGRQKIIVYRFMEDIRFVAVGFGTQDEARQTVALWRKTRGFTAIPRWNGHIDPVINLFQ